MSSSTASRTLATSLQKGTSHDETGFFEPFGVVAATRETSETLVFDAGVSRHGKYGDRMRRAMGRTAN